MKESFCGQVKDGHLEGGQHFPQPTLDVSVFSRKTSHFISTCHQLHFLFSTLLDSSVHKNQNTHFAPSLG